MKNLRCEYAVNPLGIDTAWPNLSWVIESDQRGYRQSAYRILVATSLEKLQRNDPDLWDSGKTESSRSINVTYAGSALKSGQRCFWKVKIWDNNDTESDYSAPAWWEMALLSSDHWQGIWINDGKAAPARDEDFYKDDPAPLFRKQFSVSNPVARARLYISGLGYYEASINAKRIGDAVLDPGWTTYSKRVLYSTYDVTEMLQQGDNVIAVSLGNGWYNPLPLRLFGQFNLRDVLTIGRPRLIAQLNIEYNDGSRETVVSDQNWKVTEGPILRNNVYLGEVYDARKEIDGWDSAGFADHTWPNAKPAVEPVGPLQAQCAEPVKVTDTLGAVSVTQIEPGKYIFDMGRNYAGWVRLKVKGLAGTEVKLRVAELLHPDGTLNCMTTVAGGIKGRFGPPGWKQPTTGGPGAPEIAEHTYTYILKGKGQEVYTPRFTFHGYRYVEVTGLAGKPEKDALEGLCLNSAVEKAGSFSCSNELFDRIQQMVLRAFLSNMFSVESDCPHREKLGYGGDIVAASEMAMLNFDMTKFYAKTVCDYADAIRPNGGFTETAPYVGIEVQGFGEGTGPIGWGIAHPLLQRQLYQYYGNKRLIEQQYETTKRWVEFLQKKVPDHIIELGISDHESLDPRPFALTSTAFNYYNAKLCSELAEIIGKDDDARRFAALAEEIKTAFNKRFLRRQPQFYEYLYDTGTQTCNAFVLYMDLVPPESLRDVLDELIENIKIHEGHLTTGIFGTKYILEALTRNDHADIAYDMANKKTFPGWGHMLESGATTLWERWASDDNAYSHNHPMFGSVSEWFYKAIGGINPDDAAVGFDRIIIKPNIVADLTWAKAEYNSIRGTIVSQWRIEHEAMLLNVTIPPNTEATIHVPTTSADTVTESGQPAEKAEGVTFLRMQNCTAVYKIGSGTYSFKAEWKR